MQQSDITWYPERKETVAWEAREVMRDLEGKPHLLVRIELSGVYFALRALEPFMRVGGVQSRLVLIDTDGLRARGYFDRQPPDGGEIVFGYGEQIVLVIHGQYSTDIVRTLDRKRLPRATRFYDKREARGDRLG